MEAMEKHEGEKKTKKTNRKNEGDDVMGFLLARNRMRNCKKRNKIVEAFSVTMVKCWVWYATDNNFCGKKTQFDE